MHLAMRILSQQQPTLFQQLVFQENPGLLITIAYSVFLCAAVFL